MKYCIVIDMQKDFVDGALANSAAEKIIPDMVKKVEELRNQGYTVIATRDSHDEDYMESQEGKNLPVPHCIIGTPGWEVVDELKPFIDLYVNKGSFGYPCWIDEDEEGHWSFLGGLDNAEKADPDENCAYTNLNDVEPDEIVMMGTCTGICVASNFAILKANYPEVPITVYKDLCACLTPESHEAAINTMKVQQAIIA